MKTDEEIEEDTYGFISRKYPGLYSISLDVLEMYLDMYAVCCKMTENCEMCGEPLKGKETYRIKKKIVCNDCYFNFVGDSMESGVLPSHFRGKKE